MDVLRTQVPPVVTPAGGRESPMLLGRVIRERGEGIEHGGGIGRKRDKEKGGTPTERRMKSGITREGEGGGRGLSASTRKGDTESRTTNARRVRP